MKTYYFVFAKWCLTRGNKMQLITAKAAAEKWGVTVRRVQGLCNEGKVRGAERFGRAWMIPEHAVLPGSANGEEPMLPMPRKSPFLDMTNLYDKVGKADECVEMLVNNPEAHELMSAQIAYRRGEIDKVYDHARYFLSAHSGFYAILGGGMLLAQCAMWRGDVDLWYEAKRHICEAPSSTEQEREIISLTLAIIDSSLYDNKDFPEWFRIGNFEPLPADSHPAAKVFYIKLLYMTAYGIASKQYELEGVQGLALMKMLPNTIEPLITQAVVDRTALPEAFLRLSCAVSYYYSGQREKAIRHIDKAIAFLLPDRLYGVLAEYVRHFDGLLEERIRLKNEAVLERIVELSSIYAKNWSRLSGAIRNKNIATNLTAKEHEVAKLSAFGFSTREIANMLYVSESTVKQTVARVINKTGIQEKSELYLIL